MGTRLALLGIAAAVLAGCGGGSKTNGEEKKPAAQVVADARQAVEGSRIVHVVGAGVDNGAPLKLDLWVANGKGKGHIEEGGLAFDLVRIGDVVYLRGKRSFWQRFGGGTPAALLAGKWVKAPASQADVASVAGLVDKHALFRSILEQHGKIENKGAVQYKGQPAVEIRDTTQGGSLYVAGAGTPYPIAVKGTGAQGTVTFGEWNADVPVAAPKDAVDLSGARP